MFLFYAKKFKNKLDKLQIVTKYSYLTC